LWTVNLAVGQRFFFGLPELFRLGSAEEVAILFGLRLFVGAGLLLAGGAETDNLRHGQTSRL
jgi:hypothetical protein